MNAKNFLATKLERVVRVLNKTVLSTDDRVLLKYLLNTLVDLAEYTQNLNEGQKDKLITSMHYQKLQAEQILFHKGDPSDKFFVVLSGEVYMFYYEPDGRMEIVNTLGVGRSFGERGLINNAPRMLGVV
jgi:CRP-like cAMP-binding protein